MRHFTTILISSLMCFILSLAGCMGPELAPRRMKLQPAFFSVLRMN